MRRSTQSGMIFSQMEFKDPFKGAGLVATSKKSNYLGFFFGHTLK